MHVALDLRTKDGQKIVFTCFSPLKSNGKVIIIAPTGQRTQDFYKPLALFFQGEGFTVLSFDYRGMGESAPKDLKGYSATMHQWAVQDIDAVILYARQHYPMHEIVYLGHCVGGEIVGLAGASQFINRLVLVSSSVSCTKFWPLRERFRLKTNRTILNILNKIFGYFPGRKVGFLKDMPSGVIYEWAGWCNSPNGLFDKFPDNNYRKLQIPVLSMSFSDDRHCTPKAVEELLNHFAGAAITWRHVRPIEIGMKSIGSDGFFEPLMNESLWPFVLQWLNKDERDKSLRDSYQP